MDWKGDPELRRLREGFISSFEAYKLRLTDIHRRLLEGLAGGGDAVSAKSLTSELQQVTHKISGSAGSFGFTFISTLSALLEDGLDLPLSTRELSSVILPASHLLIEALVEAQHGEDPTGLSEDPRFKQILTFVAG